MHQSTFLTTPDIKIIFYGFDSNGLEMHQNTFLTTPDIKKNFFPGLDSGGLEVCANALKHVFNHSRRQKITFKGYDSGGLEMHQNTFFTTPDVKKYLF